MAILRDNSSHLWELIVLAVLVTFVLFMIVSF